jgi:hypothetical protein
MNDEDDVLHVAHDAPLRATLLARIEAARLLAFETCIKAATQAQATLTTIKRLRNDF